MTDYRSVESLHVIRANVHVATLRRLAKGCEFRYERSVLANELLPLALHLPKTAEPLVTEGILNLPTYFAGLLPEGVVRRHAQTVLPPAIPREDLDTILTRAASLLAEALP